MGDHRSAFDLIYSALDAGRYSAAQAICERPELAKFALAKALLAYCYASQRKNDKALEVARTVVATNPIDEGTVNALGCTFKICKVDGDFAALYENVLANPTGAFPEHFHIELFAAYCRLRDFKKMQQQAQRMHRSFQSTSNSKYLFWAVASMLLQPDLPPTMISVAEKMLSKVYNDIDNKRNPGAEEMELYLSTLVLQQKFDLAVTEFRNITNRPAALVSLQDEDHFRENTNKVAKQPEELTNILLDLNLHTGNMDQLLENARSILTTYPDQWNVWELLIDKVVFHRPDTSRKDSYSGLHCFQKLASSLSMKPPAAPSGDAAAEEAADFEKLLVFNELIRSSQAKNPKLRGPALAEVRMISSLLVLVYRHPEKSRFLQRIFQEVVGAERLQLAVDTVQSLPVWSTVTASLSTPLSSEDGNVAVWLIFLLQNYLIRFQTKYVCFVDLKPTLYHIQQLKNASSILEVVYAVLLDFTGTEATQRLASLRVEVRQGRGVSGVVETPQQAAGGTETAASEAAVEAAAAEEEDGDDGDDDGDEDDAAATAAKGEDGGAKKKKANRKKKNKNKKNKNKKAAANAAAVVDLMDAADEEPKLKKVDVPALSAIVAKDEAILGRLCAFGNFLESHVYLFYLLSTLAATAAAASPATTTSYSLAVHPHEIVVFFDEVSLLFQDGIGGELRTVRPGDTAMMTVLSQCRRNYLLQAAAPTSPSGLDQYVHLLQWTGLLQHALQRSPYAYAFKVDLLENYRVLGNGLEALNLYSDSLGVKYIQNDSLSYLIIPTLLETGMFKEAAAKYRAVVAFHRTCRRDTLEMMGKAFEYGNYCKALEMNQFVEESRRSLALSVSHVEGRVMDMITNIMSVADLEQFYDMIAEENHDDTYRAFEDIDIKRLHNHQDFHLALDRLENCPVASLPYQCDLMRKEEALKARIVVPTVMMQFTYHLLADESDKLLPLKIEDISLATNVTAAYPTVVERFAQAIASPSSSSSSLAASSVTATSASTQTTLIAATSNLSLYVLQQLKPSRAYAAAASLAKSGTTASPDAAAVTENPLSLTAALKSGFIAQVEELQQSARAYFHAVLGNTYADKSVANDDAELAADLQAGIVFSVDATGQYVLSPVYLASIWSSIRHVLTWTSFQWQILLSKGFYTAATETSKVKRPVAADIYLQMQTAQREMESIVSAPDRVALAEVFQNIAAEQQRILTNLRAQEHGDHQSDVLRVLLSLLKEWIAFIVALTRKLQRLQRATLSTEAIDRFATFVAQTSSFLPLPVTTSSITSDSIHSASDVATSSLQVQQLCQPYVEKTVRTTLSFQRDGIERAATILQQRLSGLRSILSL